MKSIYNKVIEKALPGAEFQAYQYDKKNDLHTIHVMKDDTDYKIYFTKKGEIVSTEEMEKQEGGEIQGAEFNQQLMINPGRYGSEATHLNTEPNSFKNINPIPIMRMSSLQNATTKTYKEGGSIEILKEISGLTGYVTPRDINHVRSNMQLNGFGAYNPLKDLMRKYDDKTIAEMFNEKSEDCGCNKNYDKIDTDIFKKMSRDEIGAIQAALGLYADGEYSEDMKNVMKDMAKKQGVPLRDFLEEQDETVKVLIMRHEKGGRVKNYIKKFQNGDPITSSFPAYTESPSIVPDNVDLKKEEMDMRKEQIADFNRKKTKVMSLLDRLGLDKEASPQKIQKAITRANKGKGITDKESIGNQYTGDITNPLFVASQYVPEHMRKESGVNLGTMSKDELTSYITSDLFANTIKAIANF